METKKTLAKSHPLICFIAAVDWPEFFPCEISQESIGIFEIYVQAILQTLFMFEAYLDTTGSLSFEARTKDYRDRLD